jgi:multidrug efflux pump subunit AcrA (membrane-fusion protein)
MFVQAKLVLEGDSKVVSLPLSAISYAPYGDSVFVLADLKDPGGAAFKESTSVCNQISPMF